LRPRWRKVLADLWGNRSRTLLVVASIAVGVFAIGVIAGTYTMISQDLRSSYAAANPAHIEMLTLPFDRKLPATIEKVAGVGEAEGRRVMVVRLEVSPGTWDRLKLIAVPDMEIMRIFRHFPVAGSPLPEDREVVLEHKTLSNLGVTVGDTLRVELPDGATREMRVAGAVLDQSDVYGAILGDDWGFITFDTLEWLGAPLTLDRLYITAADVGADKAALEQIALAVTDRLERNGLEVFQTTVTPANEHPVGSIVKALLAVLVILGILIVFLSGSLISNTMSALLAQHLRQIGVMKLVGAQRRQVIGMYMVLILSFGIIALLFAIPLGSWGAYELSRFVAEIINFQLQDYRVVPQAILFQVVIGLLIPPLAGLFPVLKGSRVTVQKAISHSGISAGDDQKGWLNRQLERLRLLPRPLALSLRNTFRRKGRLILTLFTLTLGGAIFIAVFNTQVSVDRKAEEATRYFGADVNLDFAQPYRITTVKEEVLRIAGVADVEVWIATGAELIRAGDAPSESVALLAPPADSALVNPTLLQGRWLLPKDQNAIAVNEAVWNDYPNLAPGDKLRLKVNGKEDDWVVVGIFQYTGATDLIAYASYDYVAKLLNATHHATAFRVKTWDQSLHAQQAVSRELNRHFRDLGFKVQHVQAGGEVVASVTGLLGMLTVVLVVMALMTALVGSIGLAGTMSMNVMERTREIGVMRAIGAHNLIIGKQVIVEGMLIGLISYGFGSILSIPISVLLSNVISLSIFNSPADLALTSQGFLIWLAVVSLLAVLASLLPARNAMRLTIREVLAYE